MLGNCCWAVKSLYHCAWQQIPISERLTPRYVPISGLEVDCTDTCSVHTLLTACACIIQGIVLEPPAPETGCTARSMSWGALASWRWCIATEPQSIWLWTCQQNALICIKAFGGCQDSLPGQTWWGGGLLAPPLHPPLHGTGQIPAV